MCMITFVPAGVGDPGTDAFDSIATRTDDAHWINDDGHGFMIATPDGVWAWKGMSYDTVWGKYERALTIARERFGSVPSAFHSRIGTAGPNDATLCHPFTLGQREPVLLEAAKGSTDALWVNVSTTAMMHNGILPGKYQPGKDLPNDSDTSLYVRYFLPRLINPVTGVPGRRAAARIAADIGTGNKFLVFGSVDGKVTVRLINQDSGTWEDDGAWYSSQYYTRRPTWRNGGGYYLGGYNSGYSQYLSKPPLTKRVDNILTRDEAEAAGLRESNAYRGWWHAPDYEYYVQVSDEIATPDDEALAAWLEENAPTDETAASTERALVVWHGGACTAPKCEGTLGDQNYCRACGRCGDCNSQVHECSCLTDSAKPDFAWKAGGHVLG